MCDTTGKYMKISKFDEKILEVFYVQFDRHYTTDAIRGAYRKLRSFDDLLTAINISLKLNTRLDGTVNMMHVEME